MKTYNDLIAAGQTLQARAAFIDAAINEHLSSAAYHTAADAELYYNGENPTIGRYEKVLYDLKGKAHRDMFTANHKLASSFFRFDVNQQVAYLLGNGISFGDKKTPDKLCADFDQEVMPQSMRRSAAWRSDFGIWSTCVCSA